MNELWMWITGKLNHSRNLTCNRNQLTWLRYAEMEMRHKHLNAARNVWDRAVVLLPRVDQFWLKYSHMESMLGNYAGARQIFERWMEWEPEPHGWFAYIKFEQRFGEVERTRYSFNVQFLYTSKAAI
jgi:crooked neck